MSAPGSATPLAIACLYRALARQPERNAGLTAVDRAIAVENKWIAQRYGVHGTFAGGLGPQTVAELLEEIIAMTAEDAAALGCSNEIERCRLIITGGASADKVYCGRGSMRAARLRSEP